MPALSEFLLSLCVPALTRSVRTLSSAGSKVILYIDALMGTDRDTLETAYTFGRIGSLIHYNIHRTFFLTFFAGSTAFLIYFKGKKTDFVKKTPEGPQGTEGFAKTSPGNKKRYQTDCQDKKLQRRQ